MQDVVGKVKYNNENNIKNNKTRQNKFIKKWMKNFC